jgi:hypothetical protein
MMDNAEELLTRVVEGIGLGLAVRGRVDEDKALETIAFLDQRR